MEIGKSEHFKNLNDWHQWLDNHHDNKDVLWMIFYKIHTGIPSISYEDAVEEALCFGWIDSTIKRIDDERYARKFTPRNKNSVWSETNRKRIEKLLDEKRLTPVGIRVIDGEIIDNKIVWSKPVELPDLTMPFFFKKALDENIPVKDKFYKLASSHQKNYILWLANAKTETTRQKRLKEALEKISKGRGPGMK